MSEERKLILQMVAEGKITPDEADNLLQALDESERTANSAATEQIQREEPADVRENLGTIIDRAVGDSMRSLGDTLRGLEIDLERRTNDPAREQLFSRIEEKMRRSAERAVERARQADERARKIAERAEERAREQVRRAEEHARRFEERARALAHETNWGAGITRFGDDGREALRIFKSGVCIDKVSVARSKTFALAYEPGDTFHLENRVGDVKVEFYDGSQIEVTVNSINWGEDEQDAAMRADAFQMDLVRKGADVFMDVLRPTITATGLIMIKDTRLDYVVRLPQGTHLDIRCKAGDVVVVGTEQVGRWELLTKVGDVDVKVAPAAGFTYDLVTNLGDVRVTVADDQPGESDPALKKGAARKGRVGDGAGRLQVSAKTGDIRVIN